MVGAYGVGEVLARLERGFASKPLSEVATTQDRIAELL